MDNPNPKNFFETNFISDDELHVRGALTHDEIGNIMHAIRNLYPHGAADFEESANPDYERAYNIVYPALIAAFDRADWAWRTETGKTVA